MTSAADRAAIEKAAATAAAGPQVANVTDPFQAGAVSAAKANVEHAAQQGRDAGMTVEIGGAALVAPPAAGGATEGLGTIAAFVVPLLAFGSLAAAGVPLLSAGLGVGVSMTAITALGHALGLSSTTGTLATMLGLAVGIDYAVFIISRYREERGRDVEPREAAGTAGGAVVFAGLMVMIGLAGLFVVDMPILTKMGLAAAGAAGIGVLVSLTLVPAMLVRRVRKARRTRPRATAGGEPAGPGWSSATGFRCCCSAFSDSESSPCRSSRCTSVRRTTATCPPRPPSAAPMTTWPPRSAPASTAR